MFDAYLRYEYHLAAAQLIFAMLGMGATLTLADFVAVLRVPRGFAVGMLAQLVLIPLLALAVSHSLGLTAGLAVGLLLVAAVPGGSMSNVFTYLASGNIALSIVLTAVTTLLCLVTTPALLRLLAVQHLPAGFAMPAGRIAFEIAFCLLGPLALGMLIGASFPGRRERISRWGIRASLFCIMLIIVGSMGAGRIDATSQGDTALLALLAFAFLALLAGLGSSRLAGLPDPDRIAIGIETTIRNTNLGLLIKASLFPAIPGVPDPVADAVLFMVLLYGGFSFLVTLPAILLLRRRSARRAGAVETHAA